MLYWIFDLDYTLYDLNKKDRFEYSYLEPDDYLNKCLNRLPCKKIVFTNGTLDHAYKCLERMSITNRFNKIIARDMIRCLKPDINAYKKTMLLCDIDLNDKCVFFEDSINNFGWGQGSVFELEGYSN